MGFRKDFIRHLRAGSVFHVSGATSPLSASSVDMTKVNSDYNPYGAAEQFEPVNPEPAASEVNFDGEVTLSPAYPQNLAPEHVNRVAEVAPSPADSQNLDPEHANRVAKVKSTAPKKAPTKIFRDRFKNFLLGEGPSVSKTLATYLIAPLFVAAYPLAKLTHLMIQTVKTETALRPAFC
jgi:hypothetical protein